MNQEKIDEFVDNLDYSRIQTVMNSHNWGYWGDTQTPSIEQLKNIARYVITHALDENLDRCATGGFVFHNTPTYKELCFRLEGFEQWGLS